MIIIETFIELPHCPQDKVSKVIISNLNYGIAEVLSSYGIQYILSESLNTISGVEKNHADMVCTYLGNGKIIVAKNHAVLNQKLKSEGLEVTSSYFELVGEYHQGICALNCVQVGQYIFGNKKYIDPVILQHIVDQSLNFIDISQGYAKCSTAVVGTSAIITADRSIATAAQQTKQIDVLQIDVGDIFIESYNYGFIGGACGLLDKDILAFCGNIKSHKNYNDIKSFALNHRVQLLSLEKGSLCDIGGIIPICEIKSF